MSALEPLAVLTPPVKARCLGWGRAVCMILLLATLINYANRVVFTQNPVQIKAAFTTEGYARAETAFSLGFAFGGLFFGWLADRVSVRWLYPAVVLAWSLAGASRGWTDSLLGFAGAQALLGVFESGHWPCALRTTQRSFLPSQRPWANSLLQGGASVGAILCPLGILAIHRWDPTQWRLGFYLAGLAGIPWVILWLMTVQESDLQRPVIQTDETGTGQMTEIQEQPLWRILLSRRYALLFLTVICINSVWHFIRVWLPDTLETDHKYSHEFVQYFTSAYYLSTFCGSLIAGGLTSFLASGGWSVQRARLTVFFVCALLTTLSVPVAFLPRGPLLLGGLLLVAFGSLGLFPIFYSLNQELSAKHQGMIGGLLGFSAWIVAAGMQYAVGLLLAQDPAWRPIIFATVGCGPLLAGVLLAIGWGQRPTSTTSDAR